LDNILKNRFISFYFFASNTLIYLLEVKIILKSEDKNQIIEVRNRPYLIYEIINKTKKFPTSLFLHNDPKTMRGSKSALERENLLDKCAAIFCVSNFIKNQFIDGINKNHNKVHV